MSRSLTTILGGIVVLLSTFETSVGQMRRDVMGRPILRPNSQSPSGVVRQLMFSRDEGGDCLFSTGDDKVVRKWQVRRAAGGQMELHPADVIRWPVAADQRGTIFALDVQPDASGNCRRLAFGGMGIKEPLVELLDLARPALVQVLLPAEVSARQHFVTAVAFRPQGDILAVAHNGAAGLKDARVALWRTAGDRTELQTILSAEVDAVRQLAFNTAGDRLAAVSGTAEGQVRVWNVAREVEDAALSARLNRTATAFAWTGEAAWAAALAEDDRLALHRDGKLIQADRAPRGTYWTNSTGHRLSYKFAVSAQPLQPAEILAAKWSDLLPLDSAATRNLAVEGVLNLWVIDNSSGAKIETVGPIPAGAHVTLHRLDDKLLVRQTLHTGIDKLVRVGQSDRLVAGFFKEWLPRPGVVAGVEQLGRAGIAFERGDFESRVMALACSADGRYLAAAGIDRPRTSGAPARYQLRVWSIADGHLLCQYPPEAGAGDGGSPINNVALVQGARPGELSIQFATGAFEELLPPPPPTTQFTLDGRSIRGRLQAVPLSGKSPPPALFGTRDIIIAPRGGEFYLESGRVGPIPLLNGNLPLCYTRFRHGARKFAAIGYVAGILVWDEAALQKGLEQNPRELRRALLRSFLGHEGRVTCLATAQDGSWLVSGSDDGTISAWGLQDLGLSSEHRLELGVRFRSNGRKLFVDEVASGSPGWAAGFEKGAEIFGVKSAGHDVPVADWPLELGQPIPGRELMVTVRSSQSEYTVATNVTHDALWTLLPLQDASNWVVWTPQGVYDSSIALIDAQMYWHINPPLNMLFSKRDQNVFRIENVKNTVPEQYWTKFDYRRKILEVIERHDRSIIQDYVRNKGLADDQILPAIQVEGVHDLRDKSDFDLTLHAVRGDARGELTLHVWCNGRRLAAHPLKSSQADVRVPVPASVLRGGLNKIVVTVEVGEPGQGAFALPEVRLFQVEAAPARRRLHYLGVGVNSFRTPRHDLQPLRSAANDAWFLGQALKQLAATEGGGDRPVFDQVVAAVLANGAGAPSGVPAPTRDNILKALDDLEAEVEPDDFVCVLFAGHGQNQFRAAPGAVEAQPEFYYLVEDAGDNLESTAIRGRDLYERLNRLACPALLLIDACHSGSAEMDQTRLLNSGSLQFGPQVLLACDAGEISFEFDDVLMHAGQKTGHGLFTAAVIEALEGRRGAAASSIEELGAYVERRVPEMLGAFRGGERRDGKMLRPGDKKSQRPQVRRSVTFPPEGQLLRGRR